MSLKSTGGSNYIHFGNNDPIGANNPYSIVITVMPDASNGMLVCKRSGFTSGTNLFSISLANTNRIGITKNGLFYIWQTPQLTNGVWSTLVITGSSSGAKAFINGQQASGRNNSSAGITATSDWRTGSATSANLLLFSISGTESFNGKISKCIIYNRALNDAEGISASQGLFAPLVGRSFTADFTRSARDLTNRWAPTTVGSLSVDPNPISYHVY